MNSYHLLTFRFCCCCSISVWNIFLNMIVFAAQSKCVDSQNFRGESVWYKRLTVPIRVGNFVLRVIFHLRGLTVPIRVGNFILPVSICWCLIGSSVRAKNLEVLFLILIYVFVHFNMIVKWFFPFGKVLRVLKGNLVESIFHGWSYQ